MKCLALLVPERNVTQIYVEKTGKWINNGKNMRNEPDSLSQLTTLIIHMYTKISSFYCQTTSENSDTNIQC